MPFSKLHFYEFQKCIMCQGTGMIQIDPWAELPPNKYAEAELDQVVCPHCNGEGELKVLIK